MHKEIYVDSCPRVFEIHGRERNRNLKNPNAKEYGFGRENSIFVFSYDILVGNKRIINSLGEIQKYKCTILKIMDLRQSYIMIQNINSNYIDFVLLNHNF